MLQIRVTVWAWPWSDWAHERKGVGRPGPRRLAAWVRTIQGTEHWMTQVSGHIFAEPTMNACAYPMSHFVAAPKESPMLSKSRQWRESPHGKGVRLQRTEVCKRSVKVRHYSNLY